MGSTLVIAEPCLNCGTWNGRWNRYCKICQNDFGKTYQQLLEFIKPLVRQPNEQILQVANRLCESKHPRIRNDRPQLLQELQQARKRLHAARERALSRRADELREQLLDDLTNQSLRREYLQFRARVQIVQDRAYGEELERVWIGRVSWALTILVITIPFIPIGVKHVRSMRFVELCEAYGPLPLAEYSLSREELDTRYLH